MKTLIAMLIIGGLMSTLTQPAFAVRRGRSQTVRSEDSDKQKEVTGKVTAAKTL